MHDTNCMSCFISASKVLQVSAEGVRHKKKNLKKADHCGCDTQSDEQLKVRCFPLRFQHFPPNTQVMRPMKPADADLFEEEAIEMGMHFEKACEAVSCACFHSLLRFSI